MGICLAHQITDLWQLPQWCQSYLNTPYYLASFLGTRDNQFGFRAGHSTDQCTFFFKQAASYVVTDGSSVHAVF